MPFDWMHPPANERFAKKIASRFEEGRLLEVERRAKLLMNLNYDKKSAIRRINNDVKWEHELGSTPAFARKIKGIVDSVYRRKAG